MNYVDMLARIAANPDSSFDGRGYTEGNGENQQFYSDTPFYRSGSYFDGDMAWTPQGDGTFLVYPKVEPGHASRLNGQVAKVVDAQGNVIGQQQLRGISDNSPTRNAIGMLSVALGGPLIGGALAGAAAGGTAGAGAGAGGAVGGAAGGAGGAAAGGLGATSSLTGGLGTVGYGGGYGLSTLGGLELGAGGIGAASYGSTVGLGLGQAALGAAAAGGGALGASALEGALPPANPELMPPQLEGVPPPANPNVPGGGLKSFLEGLSPGSSKLLGPATTALGALAGGQTPPGGAGGAGAGAGAGGMLDPRMEPYIYGANGLLPQAQGLLNSQLPQSQQAGSQMMTQGAGLLQSPVMGNGYGQVKLNAPTTSSNPYLPGAMDDLGRRTNDLLGQSFNSIRGNAVASGGMGGSRQGVAEGIAMKGAADSLQGQGANLYLQAYNADQGRALQQYQGDQQFWGNQRGQDFTQTGLGADLLGKGLQTQWQPFLNATDVYKPYTGSNTQGSTQGGGASGLLGGASGLLGGALGAAQFANKMGWW
jgi:hypothetical protein